MYHWNKRRRLHRLRKQFLMRVLYIQMKVLQTFMMT